MWYKNVQTAVMNYNTTYHKTLGCEPSTVFHGRTPYNVFDLKLGIKPKWKTTPNSDIAEQLQKQIDELTKCVRQQNTISCYLISNTKSTTTEKRRQLRSKTPIDIFSTRKPTINRHNSHFRIASGWDSI